MLEDFKEIEFRTYRDGRTHCITIHHKNESTYFFIAELLPEYPDRPKRIRVRKIEDSNIPDFVLMKIFNDNMLLWAKMMNIYELYGGKWNGR